MSSLRIPPTPAPVAPQPLQPVARTDRPRSAFELPARAAADPARESREARATRQAIPLGALDTLLAVQGLGGDDRRERRRQGMKHSRQMLDGLDRLKLALIEGGDGAAVATALEALVARPPEPTGDVGLDEVIAEIDLRAQVELAKRGFGRSGP